MMKKIILIYILLVCSLFEAAYADQFVIKQIQFDGLQRISEETVLTYLPLKVGQTFSTDDTVDTIRALYKTGFFDHIRLSRQGNTLIIHVAERPTIGQLIIKGNSAIPKDKLTSVMKSVDVAEGRVYDRAVLDKIKQSLLNQYYQLGRYNARVDVYVSPLERNRVLVRIDISEGLVAKVRYINIIGNQAFTKRQLLKKLTISTPGLFTFFTQKDRYSDEKLDESIQAIHSYYMDRGYLKSNIESSQVAISPDRKSIFVTIVIHEGEKYSVNHVDVAGDLILPRDEIMKKMKIKAGDIFSRQKVLDTEKAITDALGEKGYISAEVSIKPTIDNATRQVGLLFIVKPGRKTYVHQIYFSDNTKTNDEVLRREMEQMEGALVSTTKLQQSKRRISRLPYIKDVQMSVLPVGEDQADINYKVTEDSAAQANVSVGYSQREGFLVGAGINQKNFLGTGKTLGLNFTRSTFQQFYGINFVNPYFTPDGISRNLGFSYSKFNPKNFNISKSYTTNQYSFSDVYSIPLGQEPGVFNRLQLGYGYENTSILLSNDPGNVSNQVLDFTKRHGRHFQQLDLVSGFSRDTRDRYIFPTSGTFNSIAANMYLPVAERSLSYYILNYTGKFYYPLSSQFITLVKGNMGYGNSFNGNAKDYPYFKNFYAGGMDSVHGYLDNSLGPKDNTVEPTGGNFLVDGSVGLIFPNHISDNLRTTLFFDAGNVYDTFDNRVYGGSASGPLRYSVGVQADWLTPMGLIDVSFAQPLYIQRAEPTQPGDFTDKVEKFQFSIGANFG